VSDMGQLCRNLHALLQYHQKSQGITFCVHPVADSAAATMNGLVRFFTRTHTHTHVRVEPRVDMAYNLKHLYMM